MVLAEVGQDPKEPCSDPIGVPTRIQLSVPLDQGLLHEIGSVVLASHDSHGMAVEDIAVTPYEEAKGLPIPGEDVSDHLGVGAFCG
jgi:hypothetical protein